MNTLARSVMASSAAFLFVAACVPAPVQEPEARGPLEGVWSVVAVDPMDGSAPIDPSQPGLYLFAGSHYSAVYAPGPEARVKSETSFLPNDDEMIAQYQSIIVNSGTYSVDGSSLTLRPMIAKSPGFVGGRLTGTFSVSGDTLVLHHEHLFDLDGTELADFGETLTLVRLE
ncbi:MAG TPA: hypothetical protein VK845_16040 [Gemmatimonadales bacterium]|nr:hypothetical protein [Gemmatimonadales bacterium]